MSMIFTATLLSVGGIGIAAYSQIEAGESARKAGNYNAEMDRRAAADALQRGSIDAAKIKERTRKLISSQVAAAGAGGFDSSVGTVLDLSVEAAGNGELDALTTINNAERGASGLMSASEMEKIKGQNAAQAGYLNGAGTVFQGLGSAASSFYGSKGLMAGGKTRGGK